MKHISIMLLLISFSLNYAGFSEGERIIDLEGYWKFEIGDDSAWKNPDFDDEFWEEVRVPSSWEDEGFPGYNGYAWYRVKFSIPEEYRNSSLYISLGHIDDVDETYLNGALIGQTGGFPPNYFSQVRFTRKYLLPASIINFGEENLIAIRVYDIEGIGGIIRGDISIVIDESKMVANLEFSGSWKFSLGDSSSWKDNNFDDSDWLDVHVPAKWAMYGFRKYNGVGWYRKKFTIDSDYENERLILLLGRIDDLDETYLNGKLVGKTGIIEEIPEESKLGKNCRTLRAYYLMPGTLKFGEENTLAVRVYDGKQVGGIYDGPIGIITRDNYLKFKHREEEKNKSFFERLFD